MTLQGPATRLSILVKETDQWHHRPVYTETVHRAHTAGLAGASAFRGVEVVRYTARGDSENPDRA